jgi:hypothetical protein
VGDEYKSVKPHAGEYPSKFGAKGWLAIATSSTDRATAADDFNRE